MGESEASRRDQRLAALLADVVAAPEDDGPRLVWADAIGGERGELVVLQCDRAAHPLRERIARRRRERELVAKFAREVRGAYHVDFTRGFPSRAVVPLATAAELDAPTVETLAIVDILAAPAQPARSPAEVWSLLEPAAKRAWGLELVDPAAAPDDDPRATMSIAQRLIDDLQIFSFTKTSLSIDGCGRETGEPVSLRGLHALPLSHLALRDCRLDAAALRRIRPLRELAIDDQFFADDAIDALPELVREELTSLTISDAPDAVIYVLPRALELQHLGLPRTRTMAFPRLARTKLCSLTLSFGGPAIPQRRAFDLPPTLRVLRFTSPQPDGFLLELARRHGGQLEQLALSQVLHADTHAQLVELVAGEVLDGDPLGDRPRTPTRPGEPVFFVEHRKGLFWELEPRDATVGRSRNTTMRLETGTVARLHARLRWTPQGVVIEDLGGTNGVIVAGYLVLKHVLVEGDDVQMGDVQLRYFTRRDAAIAFARTCVTISA